MNLIFGEVIAGFLCLGFSALFSASETALVSLSRPRLKKLISQRPALAAAFTEWLAAPQYLLTTILVGNTLCNVFATLLAVNVALEVLPSIPHGVMETFTWLFMTVVLFVFADFVPKSLARHYPQRIALLSIRWVSVLSRWATPILRIGLGFFEKIFPHLEGAPVSRLSVYSLEELREMIRASAVEGQVPHRSSQMMEAALRLQQVPVAKIMTPFEKVAAVNLGHDPDQVLDEVAEAGHTRVAAFRVNPKRIGGYLHVKDLLLVWRGVLPLNLDTLIRKPLYIRPELFAGQLLEEFRKGNSHLAVVINDVGDCLGIVTLQDVLEEIVGEILTESKLDDLR